MGEHHHYSAVVTWTGNTGAGTASYGGYRRDHDIAISGKPPIAGSSDPAFRGDPSRHNPEELLVASLSACHMLWFLHLCVNSGIVVTQYVDDASGLMQTGEDGGGRFIEVVLRPRVMLAGGSDAAMALALHAQAGRKCFIANSVNFPVRHEPVITVAQAMLN